MVDSPLKMRLQNDMKESMRSRDQQRLDAIRFVLSSIKQKEVDERIALDDTQVMAIVEKLIKQRKEAIEQFQKANRQDLVAKETFELTLLQSYLPEPLSEKVLQELIKSAIHETSAATIRDMGRVMAFLKPKVQGRADMGNVSSMIKSLLS